MCTSLSLTPAAQKFIGRMVRFSGLPAGSGFRLVVTPGGCSGYSSEFNVEEKPRDGDQVVEVSGLKLFLPAESRLLLDGVTIDFTETATQTGLSYLNTKATSCGCSSMGDAAAMVPGVTKIDIGSIGRGRPASLAS